ncbi:unnamed protein product [Bursaphelenchus xylophilus]|uniref:(pine wood nematode) hypothetical protein n=1 Tax=Bursaphelenchus xylophilus TaxID=6326 RepID=A0A1I7ST84_BURXY|nr:unnamed protein product [Bursaphelenchus xylophilus]CAG9108651.1 unnamed protein product [Bursaphelenchus xylophilus]
MEPRTFELDANLPPAPQDISDFEEFKKIPVHALSSYRVSQKKPSDITDARIQRYIRPSRISSVDSELELRDWPRTRTPTKKSAQDERILSHHEMGANDLSSDNIVNGRPGPSTRVATLSRPGIKKVSTLGY